MTQQVNTSIKKCDKCDKFYDGSDNNFFLNLAISKYKNSNSFPSELLENIQRNINNTSKIDWCTCYTQDKKDLIEPASANFDTAFIANSTKFDIKTIGLDFTINKNILYIENNKFSVSDFLRFCKSTKQKLHNTIFDFDFLTYEKINDEKFNIHYKKYIVKPNVLLITELHKLKENQINELKNVLSIVKERLSNNLKTFILLNQDIDLFKKTLRANNWPKNETIYNELIDLIISNFDKRLITIINDKVNTLDFETSKPKKIVIKAKKNVEVKPKAKFDTFDD